MSRTLQAVVNCASNPKHPKCGLYTLDVYSKKTGERVQTSSYATYAEAHKAKWELELTWI